MMRAGRLFAAAYELSVHWSALNAGGALFPLTPALSLRERETGIPSFAMVERLNLAYRLRTILPLPFIRGEGREGSRLSRCSVAQISNLPYRRFLICEAFDVSERAQISRALPTASRRYSRLKICATT
jgi:hypothetical protein